MCKSACPLAHADAYKKAKILHRDISDGNIVIHENSSTKKIEGLLIDWDLCKYLHELKKEPTQKCRSVRSYFPFYTGSD